MEPCPWYEVAAGDRPLLQGDFFHDCPVVVPSQALAEGAGVVLSEVVEYDVVVMSQSCDLASQKVDLVLVCPYWPLTALGQQSSYFRGRSGRESLRRGNVPGYHLLNRCDLEPFAMECVVVDFRNVYGVPFDSLQELARQRETRLRLLPPYREHLSQAFARFFMRVGLRVDSPPFE